MDSDKRRVGFLLAAGSGAPAMTALGGAIPGSAFGLPLAALAQIEITYDRHGDYASEQWRVFNPGPATALLTLIEFVTDRDSAYLDAPEEWEY